VEMQLRALLLDGLDLVGGPDAKPSVPCALTHAGWADR
jgi:hypothetical protein